MSAKIYLTRNKEFADVFRRYKVVIDGVEKGRIKNGGTFACDITAGRHTIELKIDWCGSNIIEFDVRNNEIVAFDCGSNLRGWKIFKAGKVMKETPHEWIWLKKASDETMEVSR